MLLFFPISNFTVKTQDQQSVNMKDAKKIYNTLCEFTTNNYRLSQKKEFEMVKMPYEESLIKDICVIS